MTTASRPVAPVGTARDAGPDGGWLAAALDLPIAAKAVVLAVGAESKGAFCLASGSRAWISRDFGVLTDPVNYRAFRGALAMAQAQVGAAAQIVARDLHPGYVSTALAAELGLPQCVVQHHHAHVAACLAENGRAEPVVGVCCDGAGCGPDKASWGCEVLAVTPAELRRAAHLQYFGLPGGDAAARDCWRAALGLLHTAYAGQVPPDVRRLFADVPAKNLAVAQRLCERGVQCPQTSSLGRLFDAVAFLLGVCTQNMREAEAACALEAAAGAIAGTALPVERVAGEDAQVLRFGPAVRAWCERRLQGETAAQLAADFHATVAAMLVAAAIDAAERTGVDVVALSGGCLANRRLRDGLRIGLEKAGLTVLEHRRVSCGDAGLALGQALVAAARAGA